MKSPRCLFCLPVLAQLACAGAYAQGYPVKPVRMVVPFAPGGGLDVTARILAQKLTERAGQSFIVENRTGASGIIGTEFVARSAPDGYTLLVGSQTTQAVVPAMYGLFAPAATARDVVGKLNTDAVAALNVAETKERMATQGLFVTANTPAQFAEFVSREIPRWTKIVKDAGVKPQ